MNKLSGQDFAEAAKELNCSVSAIRAVATVESGGRSGFDDKDRLLIRFEGHQFRKFTGRRFDQSHPHLSYAYGNRFGKGHTYSAFNEAFALDQHAALLATSYGMFQPMGFNYDEMGFDSVEEMVSSFQKGEREQLQGFVSLIKKWGLDDELRRATLRDFQTFAKRYNGADYKSNRYDTKMHDYYLSYERKLINDPSKIEITPELNFPKTELTPENIGIVIDANKVETALQPIETAPSVELSPNNSLPQPSQPNSNGGIFDNLSGYSTKFDQVNEVVTKVSGQSWIITILTKLAGVGLLVWSLVINNPIESILAIILIIAAIWYLTNAKNRQIEKAKLFKC